MADAALVSVAKDMTTQIGAHSWVTLGNVPISGYGSPPGTLTRAYVPRVPLDQIKGLVVTVIGQLEARSQKARNVRQSDLTVDIHVQAPIVTEPGDVDTLLGFVEEVANFVEQFVPTVTGASLVPGVVVVPSYDPATLDELMVFWSAITAVFRVGRHP